jgi:hypothetical protein
MIIQVILTNIELTLTYSVSNISEQKSYTLQTITLLFAPWKMCAIPIINRTLRPVS